MGLLSRIMFATLMGIALPALAAVSTHYPDIAENQFGGSHINTAQIQTYMDQHGMWRGNDYFVYCGVAFGGSFDNARGPISMTALFNQNDFTRPLTELERMNGGRTFSVEYDVQFRYLRSYNGLYHRWDSWVTPGQVRYNVTLRTTAARKNIVIDVRQLSAIQSINVICPDATKPTNVPN